MIDQATINGHPIKMTCIDGTYHAVTVLPAEVERSRYTARPRLETVSGLDVDVLGYKDWSDES